MGPVGMALHQCPQPAQSNNGFTFPGLCGRRLLLLRSLLWTVSWLLSSFFFFSQTGSPYTVQASPELSLCDMIGPWVHSK